MALKILAQNALDAFSDAKTVDEYIALVERLQPDVAVFTEAYDSDRVGLVESAMKRLENLGYQVTYGPYGEARPPRHGMVMLIRQGLVSTEKPGCLTRMGTRIIVEARLIDPVTSQTMHFIGAHLNDRSEDQRQTELEDLFSSIVTTGEPTIIAGDLNSLHTRDGYRLPFWPAHVLARLVKLHLFPERYPVQSLYQKKTLAWLGSRSRRLSEIASGKTIRRLEAEGFSDADSHHQPTMPSGRPFAQLDHIMTTQQITVQSFTVLPKGSSDHLGILAEITL